jgi:hypothetical protein
LLPGSDVTNDRLQELASSSVDLTQILEELRGAGLREVVGFDPLLHADAPNAVLDEFLSLAVREAPEHVIFGLALSIPACVIKRGVGAEALEYCLAHRNLSPADLDFVFSNMSARPGPQESLCAAHRRVSTVAVRAGHTAYYQRFLRDNIVELVEECPDDLADFMLDAQFSASSAGVDCLVLALEHSSDFEPYVQRWIDWIVEGRFDSAGPGNANTTVMYGYLGHYLDNPRFRAVRVAAHAHLVQLLQSPEKIAQAWRHLQAILSAPYAAADEVVTAIERSGLRRDQLGSDAFRYAWDGLLELSRDPTGRSKKFHDLLMFVLQNEPTGTR